jgi:hypothetical protein
MRDDFLSDALIAELARETCEEMSHPHVEVSEDPSPAVKVVETRSPDDEIPF